MSQEDYDLFTNLPLQYGDIWVVIFLGNMKRLARKYNKDELAKEYVNSLF
jgi:hypothetical protein